MGPAPEAPLEAEVERLERAPVALVVDAVKGVDGGHAGPARGQASVEPRALAVRVDDLDAESPDQADGREQRTRAEPARRNLRDGEAEGAKALEERAVARPRHGQLELAPREATREVVHLARAAAGRRRGEQLEDPDQAPA